MVRYKIYVVSFQDKPFYVGMTTKIVEDRLKDHIDSVPGKKHSPLFSFFRDGLSIHELDRTESNKDAYWLEMYWIHQFLAWGFNLYNKNKVIKKDIKRIKTIKLFKLDGLIKSQIEVKKQRGDSARIAEKAGCSDELMRLILNDDRRPRMEHYEVILSYYGINANVLQ